MLPLEGPIFPGASFQTALFLSTVLSLLCMVCIQIFAQDIAVFLLNDSRCEPLLKVMSYALPFASVHSCICGYSLGLKQTKIPGISQLVEQCARVLGVYLLYTAAMKETDRPGLFLPCVDSFGRDRRSLLQHFCRPTDTLYKKYPLQTVPFPLIWNVFGKIRTCRSCHSQPNLPESPSKRGSRLYSKKPDALRIMRSSALSHYGILMYCHAVYFVPFRHHQFHFHDDAPYCG